jgi:hypothetical protein
VHDLAKGRLGIPGFGSLDCPVAGSSGSSGSKVRLSSPPQRHPLLQALGIESILERENQSGKKSKICLTMTSLILNGIVILRDTAYKIELYIKKLMKIQNNYFILVLVFV